MATFKTPGMDDLQRDLRKLQQNARKMEGKHEVSFNELFTQSFMREHTKYSSINELLQAGGFKADTDEEFDAIPRNELDAHITKSTRFRSWDDMLDHAVEQYTLRQLGF